MRHRHTRRLLALAAALGVLLLGAAAWAHTPDLHAWTGLLAQHTGGSFGGSSWGSGGSPSSGGGSSSSGGGSSSSGDGNGIADFLVGLVFELLWQAFLACLRHYPVPTLSVLAVGAIYLWATHARSQWEGAPVAPTLDGDPRAEGLTEHDRALLRALSVAMLRTSRVGVLLSACVGLGGLVSLAHPASAPGARAAGLAALIAGLVGAWTARQTLRTAASVERADAERHPDRVAVAVAQLGPWASWTGTLLAWLLALTTVVAVVVLAR